MPDVETVRSTFSVRAVPDLFKNGKLKLRCTATMFTLYRRIKEIEMLEDAPLLALIMVPTTPANEGINIYFSFNSLYTKSYSSYI